MGAWHAAFDGSENLVVAAAMLEDAIGQRGAAPSGGARSMTARTGPIEQASALDGGIRIVGEGIIRNVNLLRNTGVWASACPANPRQTSTAKRLEGFENYIISPSIV